MTIKLLFLILSFALLTFTIAAQDNFRPKQKDLSWGIESKGLRMSAWTNLDATKVFIAVRNFSTKKICYCNPEDFQYTVYARKNAESMWQPLINKTMPDKIIWLPLCHLINLKPAAEKTFYVLKNKVRKKTNYSFSLNLREYNFPADWSGTVEVKIVQPIVLCPKDDFKGEPESEYLSEIESPIIKIKLPFTEVIMQR
jgi:hypothetical protein